jgi:hypothetical protein
MADHDVPNRIDRVFVDGRLIDEAVEAAVQDAIDRHRDAGLPVVIARDGHPVEVPASALSQDLPEHEPHDLDTLLTDAELSKERTPKELRNWVDDRCAVIRRCVDANEPAMLHRRPFKRLYEEMCVFRLFVEGRYGGRDGVRCALNPDDHQHRDYDAMVRDHTTDPPTVTYVQLTTTTFDRNESRRMKKFMKEKFVPAYGPSDVLVVFTHEEMLAGAFDKIDRAIRQKAKFAFGPNYVLIVSFDDIMWFGTDDDEAALKSFVTTSLPSWGLNVATLYVVGISGRTFLSFPTSRP